MYYELLKPGETVTAERCQQLLNLSAALREKRPENEERRYKVRLLHDMHPHTSQNRS